MFWQPVNSKADIAHACSPSGRFSHVEWISSSESNWCSRRHRGAGPRWLPDPSYSQNGKKYTARMSFLQYKPQLVSDFKSVWVITQSCSLSVATSMIGTLASISKVKWMKGYIWFSAGSSFSTNSWEDSLWIQSNMLVNRYQCINEFPVQCATCGIR